MPSPQWLYSAKDRKNLFLWTKSEEWIATLRKGLFFYFDTLVTVNLPAFSWFLHSYLKITVVGHWCWCICACFVVKKKAGSCLYVCRYYSSFWRVVWNSHLYHTESLGWEVLCPEGSSSESDSKRWACKGGIRFPFVPLRFWVDIGVFNSLMGRGRRLIC